MWVLGVHVHLCTMCMFGADRGYKEVADSLGSLQKQQILLTSLSSLSNPQFGCIIQLRISAIKSKTIKN